MGFTGEVSLNIQRLQAAGMITKCVSVTQNSRMYGTDLSLHTVTEAWPSRQAC